MKLMHMTAACVVPFRRGEAMVEQMCKFLVMHINMNLRMCTMISPGARRR